MYKIGDKVRIVSERDRKMNANGKMDKYLGTVMTVASKSDSGFYLMKEDDGKWAWHDAHIEGLAKEEKEWVDHPDHYNQGKIEVIDAIIDWELTYLEGNIIKYIARARHKGTYETDIRKAAWHIQKLVDELDKGKEEFK